jgi:hypothetical protein
MLLDTCADRSAQSAVQERVYYNLTSVTQEDATTFSTGVVHLQAQ